VQLFKRQGEAALGAFGRTAFDLCALGLVPTPTGGPDGKHPMLRGYNKTLITPVNVAMFQRKFGDANVALVTGPSNINVLDIDDPDLLPAMRRRFGDSPLIVRTAGRGGFQIYYRSDKDVRLTDLRSTEGLAVEIKTAGGIVIAPPSRNPKTGRNYEFVEGDFSVKTLRQLPMMNVGAIFGATSAAQHRRICEGRRNNWLFSVCMRAAIHCDAFEALLDVGRTRNNECEPALDDAEVLKVVSSAWNYTVKGLNFTGGNGAVILSREEIEDLCKRNPGDPFFFSLRLRLEHTPRVERGETFALSTPAMEQAGTFDGWSRQNLRTAIKNAIRCGFLKKISGRRGALCQYTLPRNSAEQSWLAPNHNVTNTPHPHAPTKRDR
jgi:hypothetical protein